MHELDHQFTIISVNELKCAVFYYSKLKNKNITMLHLIGWMVIFLFIPNCYTAKLDYHEKNESNFIGASTKDIAQILFKNYEKNETNFIFSPLGYSVILGILAEGVKGIARKELSSILNLPDDTILVRQRFKTILERLQDKNPVNVPEFKNYFYVYKNFTIEDDYKKVLLESYFTEVKYVERSHVNESEMSAPLATEPFATEIYTELPSLATTPSTNNNSSNKLNKKIKQQMKRIAKRFLGINLEDEPRNEVSGISANNMKNEDQITRSLSKIIIFNGLYFKGFWKTPFQFKQGEEPFYKNKSHTVMTKMVYTVGQFYVGNIPELSSDVLFIPYKGERYSFVIILPKEKDGLPNSLANLTEINLQKIRSSSELKNVQISIPAFEFNTITYLKEPLSKNGINKIFSNEADFSGISKDSGLYVDDIVQLVTIKVDDEAGTPNFLTATLLQTRTVTEKFTIDHPFLFFVQDHKDDLIIATGKLYEPMKEEDFDYIKI